MFGHFPEMILLRTPRSLMEVTLALLGWVAVEQTVPIRSSCHSAPNPPFHGVPCAGAGAGPCRPHFCCTGWLCVRFRPEEGPWRDWAAGRGRRDTLLPVCSCSCISPARPLQLCSGSRLNGLVVAEFSSRFFQTQPTCTHSLRGN